MTRDHLGPEPISTTLTGNTRVSLQMLNHGRRNLDILTLSPTPSRAR